MGMTDRQFDAYRMAWLTKLKTMLVIEPNNQILKKIIEELADELNKN
jgi:hypothetical protein